MAANPLFVISEGLAEWLDARPGRRSVARAASPWTSRVPMGVPSRAVTDDGTGSAGDTLAPNLVLAVDRTAGATNSIDRTVTPLANTEYGTLVRVSIDAQNISGTADAPLYMDPLAIVAIADPIGSGKVLLVVAVISGALWAVVALDNGATVVLQELDGLATTDRFVVKADIDATADTVQFYAGNAATPIEPVGPAHAATVNVITGQTSVQLWSPAAYLTHIYSATVDTGPDLIRFVPEDTTGWTLGDDAEVITP